MLRVAKIAMILAGGVFGSALQAAYAEVTHAGLAKPSQESVASENYAFVEEFLSKVLGRDSAERRALAESALRITDELISENSADVSAHLANVAALGTLARTLDKGESIKGRYGSKSRDAVHALLDVAPDDPIAMALAGVWNYEVVRRGGVTGSFLLGASTQKGEELLGRAMKADTGNAVVPFAYAVVLTSLDSKEHMEQSLELLEECQIRAGDQPTSLSVLVAEQAGLLSGLLKSGDFAEARKFAENVM